ncbi:unnamed protein product [Caenorhabditis angaria]|uniref:Uncharacterized protein n=1 Tax=Caenorhabditis angaria TaxID=860376 RepID=A0A9P1IAA3_9PELO|nr:unnamed protein product [Caenorhabditis angaria]
MFCFFRFSIIFKTEENEYTRFRYRFDDSLLRKIDIDSLGAVQPTKAPKLIGSCRETEKKVLKINIKTLNSSFITFQMADQTIRRPFDFHDSNLLKVMIPQNVSCCLIRALFLTSSEHAENRAYENNYVEEKVSTKLRINVNNRTTTTSVQPAEVTQFPETVTKLTIRSTTEKPKTKGVTKGEGPHPWSAYTVGVNPVATSTTVPKSALSWTHSVNKEWSVTFVICSIIVCSLMLFLILFGVFMFFYLMTKPRGGKSPYRIDA